MKQGLKEIIQMSRQVGKAVESFIRSILTAQRSVKWWNKVTFYRIEARQEEIWKRLVLTKEELDDIGIQLGTSLKKSSYLFGSSMWIGTTLLKLWTYKTWPLSPRCREEIWYHRQFQALVFNGLLDPDILF
jgi:hypothetical protein